MHLEKLELNKFRQHDHLEVEFVGNLIAIRGKNGSGKSNLIGGIQFALTGEQPGFTKADLTKWGEKEGTGSVKLVFTAGAKHEQFVIVRKTNGDVTLKVGDETIKQARKVEEALKDRADLDKELIRQVVFVNQKETDKFLSVDPKDREMALQRIAGIGQANKIFDYLRGVIAQYNHPEDLADLLLRSKMQLGEQQEAAKVCREALARYDAAIKVLPSKEALEKAWKEVMSANSAITAYVTASRSLHDTQRMHEEALKKLADMGAAPEGEEEALRGRLADLQTEVEQIRSRTDEAKEYIRFLTRLDELSVAAKDAAKGYNAAKRALDEVLAGYGNSLEDAKKDVDRLEAAQIAAESELRSLRSLVKEASSDGTCPVCGAPASQEEISSHLKERLDKAEKKAREAREASVAAEMAYDKRDAEERRATESLRGWASTLQYAESGLQKAKDANVEGCSIDMDTYEVSYKGCDPDDIQDFQEVVDKNNAQMADVSASIGRMRAELSKIEATKREAKEARDNVSRLAVQIDVLVENERKAYGEVSKLGMDPLDIGFDSENACRQKELKAREDLDAYNDILRDMAAEKARLEAAENTIASTMKFIESLVGKQAAEEVQRARADVLKRVREWFGYKVGPRLVSQQVMEELTDSVNSYLRQFDAPFVVEADQEGCGFRCRFTDGREMPHPYPEAHMLSGGQKVALSFAFHLAIYMRYGSQLGFLSLDEPTAYLDDANITHMGELLEKVGAVARNKGLQIIMATHEKAIMPFLDTKIDLDELKGE